MPATSPGFESITSAEKPRVTAHFRYMRSSICAQSWASVPPAPAWMSRNALCASISPRNMRLNSSARTLASYFGRSRSMSLAVDSSSSASASSSSSSAERTEPETRSISASSPPSRARSRPSSWARSGWLHTAWSSSSRLTSSRRSRLRSYSKEPPQGERALLEIFKRPLELSDFHRPTCTFRGLMVTRAREPSGRQQVLHHQLQASLAQVIVAAQPVDQPHPPARQRRRVLRIHVVEGDGLKSAPPFARRDLEFEMALSQHPWLAAHLEHTVKQRLGKGRAPRATGPQRRGQRQRNFLGLELTVGFDRVPERAVRHSARHLRIES